MVIWVLYKRFKNIYGPEQNDNTITQNMIKIKMFVPGKVLRSLSSSLLTLRCCCSALRCRFGFAFVRTATFFDLTGKDFAF